ncbi:hypothetical protein CPHO_02500 [Corynebacterium phocae]|uniref:Mycothiol acetyltransferase n=1 Tax=Corynebacterium phocae TaxID=161895 RepID=A0A1L7D1X0_9CORY|nr:mycothiol synthase [Corynebacterium phocae]APT91961.1 hypothetical protein CPHO_02500 [Corynebacterium phocae]KAA8726954.1 mycothiol synthase [Corynebacterium phocae]
MEQVKKLLAEAAAADGYEPLSEQFVLGLTDSRLGHQHVVRKQQGRVIGLWAHDGQTAEMVVHPDHRRQGIGSALLAKTPVAGAPVWAHGNIPAAQGFAHAHGLKEQRRLLVMKIAGADLQAVAVRPETELEVADYAVSAAKFGRDAVDHAWVAANNEAFSWHPEQGGWDTSRLHRAMEASWFDPEGVVMLWDGKKLAGFHWTKWHGGGLGEVYVVGLSNAYRGQGLGAPLLHAGLEHLHSKGATEVILYVEADNTPAVAAYEKLGFAVSEEHVLYGA